MLSSVQAAGNPEDVPQQMTEGSGYRPHVMVVTDDAANVEEGLRCTELEPGSNMSLRCLSRGLSASSMMSSTSLCAASQIWIWMNNFVGFIPSIEETDEPAHLVRRRTFEGKAFGVRLWELASVFGSAGCYAVTGTSILTFHQLLVDKMNWLSDAEFNDVYAMSMALPGPDTTTFAVVVGIYRAGVVGGMVAVTAWCLPSLIPVIGLGMASAHLEHKGTPTWLAGVEPAAVALIYVTFFRLASKMVDTSLKIVVTMLSICISVVLCEDKSLPFTTLMWALPMLLVLGGLATLAEYLIKESCKRKDDEDKEREEEQKEEHGSEHTRAKLLSTQETYRFVAVPWYAMYGFLIAVVVHFIVVVSGALKGNLLNMYGKYFLTGISVYGGGNVLVPLLVHLVVRSGWISMDQFLQGYALVNILPGPSFNLAGYLGAVYLGLPGAVLAWVGLTLPSILLAHGLLPMWHSLRHMSGLRPFLSGMSCAGVGLILTAALGLSVHVMTTSAALVAAIVAAVMVGAFNFQVYIGIAAAWGVGVTLSRLALGLGQTQLLIPVK